MFFLIIINHFSKIHCPPEIFQKYSNKNFLFLLIFLPVMFQIRIKYFKTHFCCNFREEFRIFSIFFLKLYIDFNFLLSDLLLYERIQCYGHITHGRDHRYFDRTCLLGLIKPWSFRTKR
jgi:hypothetical protein